MMRGVLCLAVAAALWTLPALADPAEIPTDVFLATQGDDQYLARNFLLFAKVQDADGQIIGDVEDLILNGDNQVVGVVMGTGGFIGLGEKRIAVHLSALQIENEDGKVRVKLPQATKEVLDALPAFERKQPPKSLFDRAIERAKELSAKSSVTARDAYERAKEEARPRLKRARESAEKAYEEDVKPALEKARKAAEGAYEGAREALQEEPAEPEAASPSEPTPSDSSP